MPDTTLTTGNTEAQPAPTLVVRAQWDAEAKVWWAESDDIPGLVTEAPTYENLVENAMALAPELLAANRPGLGVVAVDFHQVRQLVLG